MYLIKINNMKFHSHIGVYQEEKKLGQNIEIDLVVAMNTEPRNDQVEDTISYSTFYKTIAKIVNESRVDLVETLAQTIIKELKDIDSTKIDKVTVQIRKMAVPIDGIFDSVAIEMEG